MTDNSPKKHPKKSPQNGEQLRDLKLNKLNQKKRLFYFLKMPQESLFIWLVDIFEQSLYMLQKIPKFCKKKPNLEV